MHLLETVRRSTPFDPMRNIRRCMWQPIGGVFAQRAHNAGTAPIIKLIIPETPLKATHLQKRA